MSQIHPTALVDPSARLGEGCEVGPYCIIGPKVILGERCKLRSHVVLEGHTEIGEANEFFPFAVIGQKSQDLKYVGEPTFLKIGDRNVFRENVTVHCSTNRDLVTRIGDDNLFLAYSHVAHECQVGNHTIFSNNGTLAGHVEVGDYAIISGLTAVHQFCRVGEHSITGGCSKIVQDIPPFMIVDGNPAVVRGVNEVGMKRRGFDEESIRALRVAYKKLFLRKDGNLKESLSQLKSNEVAADACVLRLIEFVESTERGVTR